MSDYHEPPETLDASVRDAHRALTSLREEVEAVDWYHQRVATCTDESLAAILAHNRDEEIEHAAMTLEWLRRRYPTWDAQLRKYLFTDLPITQIERPPKSSSTSDARGLSLGSRKAAVVR